MYWTVIRLSVLRFISQILLVYSILAAEIIKHLMVHEFDVHHKSTSKCTKGHLGTRCVVLYKALEVQNV